MIALGFGVSSVTAGPAQDPSKPPALEHQSTADASQSDTWLLAAEGAVHQRDGWADFEAVAPAAWGLRGEDLGAVRKVLLERYRPMRPATPWLSAEGVVLDGSLAPSSVPGLDRVFEAPDAGSTWSLGFRLYPGQAELALRLVELLDAEGGAVWVPQLVPRGHGGAGLDLEPGVWNHVTLVSDGDVTGSVRVVVGDGVMWRRLERDHEHPKGHGAWRPAGRLFAGLAARDVALQGMVIAHPVISRRCVTTERLLDVGTDRDAASGFPGLAADLPAEVVAREWGAVYGVPHLRPVPGVNFASAGTYRRQVVAHGDGLAWAEGHWSRRDPFVVGAAAEAGERPFPRTCHAVVSLGGGEVLVFGGELRDTHAGVMANGSDTWIYDMIGDTWRRVEGPEPPPRCHIGMAVTPDGRTAFLQSGWFNPGPGEESLVYADTWLFDRASETWRELPESDPACLITDVQPVFDAKRERFVFIGTKSLWSKDAGDGLLEWSDELPPLLKQGGGAFRGMPGEAMTWYDPRFGVVVRWGGYVVDEAGQKRLQDDVFVYLPEQHMIVQRARADVVPAPRTRGAVAYDTRRDRMVLFGGILGELDERANDLWTYDLESNTWTELQASNMPGPRGGYFGMAYDERADAYLLPFGRQGKVRFLDQVWRLELRPEESGSAFWWFEGEPRAGHELRATWAGDVKGELRVVAGGEKPGELPGELFDAVGDSVLGVMPVQPYWIRVEAVLPPGARLERLEWVAVAD